jgi:hypothetical protein
LQCTAVLYTWTFRSLNVREDKPKADGQSSGLCIFRCGKDRKLNEAKTWSRKNSPTPTHVCNCCWWKVAADSFLSAAAIVVARIVNR